MCNLRLDISMICQDPLWILYQVMKLAVSGFFRYTYSKLYFPIYLTSAWYTFVFLQSSAGKQWMSRNCYDLFLSWWKKEYVCFFFGGLKSEIRCLLLIRKLDQVDIIAYMSEQTWLGEVEELDRRCHKQCLAYLKVQYSFSQDLPLIAYSDVFWQISVT